MPNETQNPTYKCPVCNSGISKPESFKLSDKVHGNTYNCPRCGEYQLESFACAQLKKRLDGAQKIAVLSHWIRTKHEAMSAIKSGGKEQIILTDELVENIIKQPPPSPAEQADKFVLWLGSKVPAPGEEIFIHPSTHQAIIGAETPNGFGLVIHHLFKTGIITGTPYDEPGKADVTLSFEGWKHYENLKRGATDSRKAFMAMKYNDAQLDKIVDDVFKPAVKQTGFELFKLVDKPQPAGLIDDRIRVEIQTSRFLMADLTHENRGAYWEAGYAEGLGKPVIYTCEKKKFKRLKTHFDTNHHLTILWDAENPKEAAEKLKATIRATLPEAAKLTDD